MKKINKNELKGAYGKSIIWIYESFKSVRSTYHKGYLPYSDYNSKICRGLSITKEDARELLQIFSDLGYLTIAKRGIVLNYQVI